MAHTSATPFLLTQRQARRIWIKAQRLDTPEPFGSDEQATRLAIDMKRHNAEPKSFLRTVTSQEVRKILKRIESEGPLSIRDVDDDELTEKEHPWGSRKPSKRAMQYAFYSGELAISARVGVVKTYELLYRHFGWDRDLTKIRSNCYHKPESYEATDLYALME